MKTALIAGVEHREALDCPCQPEVRHQLGGGRVYVHRQWGLSEGRPTESYRAPDRLCSPCGALHFAGHPHLESLRQIRATFRERIDAVLVESDEARRAVNFLAPRG